jgi:hypothetical protein
LTKNNLHFRHELPLVDYITTIGNFDAGFIKTGLYGNGYYDLWNVDSAEIIASEEVKKLLQSNRYSVVDDASSDSVTFECVLKPSVGILNSSKPLVPGCEFKLSFDRAKAAFALINLVSDVEDSDNVLSLKNLHLRAKYFSSPFLRNYFSKIEDSEIKYNYDECSCYLKSLPTGETSIRLANVIGGQTPTYIFCGVIKSKSLEGDFEFSSTRFQRHGVKEFELSLNGYSCSGFPIINQNGSALPAYSKWLKSTNRYFNNKCSEEIAPLDFKRFHFIYSHKFEGEPTDQGWIGIDMKLESAFNENYTLGELITILQIIIFVLVIWTVNNVELSIDKFFRVEKTLL